MQPLHPFLWMQGGTRRPERPIYPPFLGLLGFSLAAESKLRRARNEKDGPTGSKGWRLLEPKRARSARVVLVHKGVGVAGNPQFIVGVCPGPLGGPWALTHQGRV